MVKVEWIFKKQYTKHAAHERVQCLLMAFVTRLFCG